MLKRRKASKQFPTQCSTIGELPYVTEYNSNQIERTLYCFLLRIDFNNTNNNKPDFFYVTDFTSNDQVTRPMLPKRHDIYGYTLQDNQVFQLDVLRWRSTVMLEEYDAKFNKKLAANLPSVSSGNINIVTIHNQLMLLKVGIILKLYRGTLECKTIGIDLINYYDEPQPNRVYVERLYQNLSSNLPPYFFQKLHPFPQQVIPSQFLTTESGTWIPVNNTNEASVQNLNQPARSVQLVGTNVPEHDTGSDSNLKNEPPGDAMVEDIEFNDDYFSSPSSPQPSQGAGDYGSSLTLHAPDHALSSNQLMAPSKTYSISELSKTKVDDNRIYPINGYIIGCNLQDLSHACAKTYEAGSTTDPILRGFELIISDSKDELLTPSNSLTLYIKPSSLLNFFELESIELLYLRLPVLNTQFNKYIDEGKRYRLNLVSTKMAINETDEINVWTLHHFKFKNLNRSNDL